MQPLLTATFPDTRLSDLGLAVFEFEEDGLGPTLGLAAELQEDRFCVLKRHKLSPYPENWQVECELGEHMGRDLEEVLTKLQVRESEITWVSGLIQLPMVEVWRQDENGRQVLVSRCRFSATAEAEVRAYEERGHKQMYWSRPAAESSRGA